MSISFDLGQKLVVSHFQVTYLKFKLENHLALIVVIDTLWEIFFEYLDDLDDDNDGTPDDDDMDDDGDGIPDHADRDRDSDGDGIADVGKRIYFVCNYVK